MKGFLSKKRFAFPLFFIITYLITLSFLFGMRTIADIKYAKEKTEKAKDYEVESKVVYEKNGITIRQLGIEESYEGGFIVNMEITNHTEKQYYIFDDYTMLNRMTVSPSGFTYEKIEAKSTALFKFGANSTHLKEFGYDKVYNVKSNLIFSEEEKLVDSNETNSFVAEDVIDISLSGAETLAMPTYEPKGDVVFERDGIKIKFVKLDNKMYNHNLVQLYIENTREEDIQVAMSSFDADGKSLNEGNLSEVVVNKLISVRGKTVYYDMMMPGALIDLQQEYENGNFLKIRLGTLNRVKQEAISDDVYEVIIK